MICDDAHSLAADGDDAAAGWTHCSEMYRNKDGHKKKKNHNIQTNIRKKLDFQINTPYSGATAAP